MSKGSRPDTPLKPPYGNIAWYKKFFELIRTSSFDRFDKQIIELNIVQRANATMLFNGLRFLGIVEDDGKVTDKFESLRRKGDEFKKNLESIVKEAYSYLFSKVVLSSANPETLFNYFAQYYSLGEAAASASTKIFTYLCQEAGIALSPELAEGKYTVKRKPRTKKDKKKKEDIEDKESGTPDVPDGMLRLEYGDRFIMLLRRGNRSVRLKTATIAKQFLDTYVQEAEEESEKQTAE